MPTWSLLASEQLIDFPSDDEAAAADAAAAATARAAGAECGGGVR